MSPADKLAASMRSWPDGVESIWCAYGSAGRYVTQSEWQKAVDALYPPLLVADEWNGEGLPPVGMFVHIHNPEGTLMYGHGESGKVVAHVENTAVVRMSYGLGCFTAKHLRTPEQIAAEERETADIDAIHAFVLDRFGISDRDAAKDIYTRTKSLG